MGAVTIITLSSALVADLLVVLGHVDPRHLGVGQVPGHRVHRPRALAPAGREHLTVMMMMMMMMMMMIC